MSELIRKSSRKVKPKRLSSGDESSGGSDAKERRKHQSRRKQQSRRNNETTTQHQPKEDEKRRKMLKQLEKARKVKALKRVQQGGVTSVGLKTDSSSCGSESNDSYSSTGTADSDSTATDVSSEDETTTNTTTSTNTTTTTTAALRRALKAQKEQAKKKSTSKRTREELQQQQQQQQPEEENEIKKKRKPERYIFEPSVIQLPSIQQLQQEQHQKDKLRHKKGEEIIQNYTWQINTLSKGQNPQPQELVIVQKSGAQQRRHSSSTTTTTSSTTPQKRRTKDQITKEEHEEKQRLEQQQNQINQQQAVNYSMIKNDGLFAVRDSYPEDLNNSHLEYLYKPANVSFIHCVWLSRFLLPVQVPQLNNLPQLPYDTSFDDISKLFDINLLIVKNIFEMYKIPNSNKTIFLCEWLGAPFQLTWETEEDLLKLAYNPNRTLKKLLFDCKKSCDHQRMLENLSKPSSPLTNPDLFVNIPPHLKDEQHKWITNSIGVMNTHFRNHHPLIILSSSAYVRMFLVVQFICNIAKTSSRGPFLIITTPQSIEVWMRFFRFIDPEVSLLDYTSLNRIEREIAQKFKSFFIEDHDNWHSSLLTKIPNPELHGKTKFQVLFVSSLNITRDINFISSITWNSIVLDVCYNRGLSNFKVVSIALKSVQSLQRIVVSWFFMAFEKNPIALFLSPSNYEKIKNAQNAENDGLYSVLRIKQTAADLPDIQKVEPQMSIPNKPEKWNFPAHPKQRLLPRAIAIPCVITSLEREHYSDIVSSINSLLKLFASKNDAKTVLAKGILDRKIALARIIVEALKVINSPPSFADFHTWLSKSGKFATLNILLSTLEKTNKRIVINTSTSSCFGAVSKFLELRGTSFLALSNSTPQTEQAIIQQFNNSKTANQAILLLQTRATWVGENLIDSSTFIQIDTDIGRFNNIEAFCAVSSSNEQRTYFRLVATQTIEEAIYFLTLLSRKGDKENNFNQQTPYLSFAELTSVVRSDLFVQSSLPLKQLNQTEMEKLIQAIGFSNEDVFKNCWSQMKFNLENATPEREKEELDSKDFKLERIDLTPFCDSIPSQIQTSIKTIEFTESNMDLQIQKRIEHYKLGFEQQELFLSLLMQFGIFDSLWTNIPSQFLESFGVNRIAFSYYANSFMRELQTSQFSSELQRQELLDRIGIISLIRKKIIKTNIFDARNAIVYSNIDEFDIQEKDTTLIHSKWNNQNAIWTKEHDLQLLKEILRVGYGNWDSFSHCLTDAAVQEMTKTYSNVFARVFILDRLALLEHALLIEDNIKLQQQSQSQSQQQVSSCSSVAAQNVVEVFEYESNSCNSRNSKHEFPDEQFLEALKLFYNHISQKVTELNKAQI